MKLIDEYRNTRMYDNYKMYLDFQDFISKRYSKPNIV